uniref:Obscurin like cytoskeletal adaptor 1b n=1 Tax=Callorhinchus milii TaxID=7868 RepID=A0A4W3I0N4_CALMI
MDVFGGAPRFLAYPRTLSVPSGADAVLKCQIGGDPRPEVYWERDKERLLAMGRYRLLEDGTVYNLIIARVGLEDSGQYICKAKNTVGETYAAATLRVEATEPSNGADPPAFLVKPASSRVVRGDSVLFSCHLSGRPEPLVTWEKDGRGLSDIFESSHFHAGRADGGWYFLKILSVRTPDAGVYVCKAQSEFGEAMGAAVLLVDPGNEEGPVDGDGTRPTKVKVFSVTEGKHAKFRCYVSGKPKPEVVWRKDNVVIVPGRRHLLCEDRRGYCVLKVLYCRQRDSGLYACTASNAAGHTLSAVLLTVNEPVSRFPRQLVDVTVLERAVAVLECEVPGMVQAGALEWFLEDRRLLPSNKYVMECDGTVHRLTITNITADDDGVYLCETRDGSRSVAEVAVRGVIVRRLPRRVTVLVGEHAALCVELGETGLDGHWYWEGEALSESPTTIIKSFGKTHILVLVSVALEDSGIITFVVNDSKTSTELRVKCTRNVPSCPIGARMSRERLNAASLMWEPPADGAGSAVEGYIIERQEVGTEEWVQCLTTTSSTAVEILGDSVPAEADYSFRVCTTNKYGQSSQLLFPGSIHLVPAARIRSPLRDVTVKEMEDAEFSIELSASVLGTWYVGGEPALQSERFRLVHARTRHSILIPAPSIQDSHTEVTFLAHGVRDSAILYVTEPAVRIVNTMDDTRGEFTVGERVALVCQLSSSTAAVTWYRDGLEVGATEEISTEADGVHRRLVIHCASTEHSGEYVCDAGNDSIFYDICVREPPVRIVRVAEWARQCVVGTDVVLSCELSRANAEVTWYKGEVEVEIGERMRVEAEGVHRRLAIHSATLEDSGTYVCQVGDDETAFEVQVSGQYQPHNCSICVTCLALVSAVRLGTDVVLSCELSRANAEVTWYKGEVKVEPGERMRVEAESVHRRLAIHSATLEDSSTYVCHVGEDETAFEVQVSEPPVRIVRVAEWARQCVVGTDVVLSCELSRANAEVTWYKGEVKVEPGERMRVEAEGVHRRLAIHSATLEDSDTYVCQADDDETAFEVQVSEPPVRIVRVAEGPWQCVVGTDVVLSCELSRAKAEVTWYKGEVEVELDERVRLEAEGVHRRLAIHSTTLEDSGTYVCHVGDDETVIVRVAEWARQCVVGTDVVLSCELSRANAEVTWYKGEVKVEPGERMRVEAEGVHRRLAIHSATLEDSGTYVCHAGDDETAFEVQVSEPPVRIVRVAEGPRQCVVGTDVVLSCELSRANAEVTWYKGEVEVELDERVRLEAEGVHRRLAIHSTTLEDSGTYVCQAGDDETAFEVQISGQYLPLARFLAELCCVTVLEGEDARFKCLLSPEDARLTWRLDGSEVSGDGSRYEVSQSGLCHTLVMHSCQPGKAITVTAETSATAGFAVFVTETQIVFTRKLESRSVEEMQEVTLEVGVSTECAEVRWLKQGVLVQPGNKYSLHQDGTTRRLTIHSCCFSDRGTYQCETLHDRTQARLTIECECVSSWRGRGEGGQCWEGGVWGLHGVRDARRITVRKPLVDVLVHEKDAATFELELSHPAVPGVWLKDGIRVKPSSSRRVTASGHVHSLTLCSLEMQDTGTIAFQTDSVRCSARLTVTGTPALRLEPVQVREKDNALFVCELSQEGGSGEWFQNGHRLKPSDTIKIRQEGTKHFLLLYSVRLEDAGEIRFVSKQAESVTHLDVDALPVRIVKPLRDKTGLEKHRVILECKVSTPRAQVRWYRGDTELQPSDRHQICAEGAYRQLIIHSVTLEDEGTYMCDAYDDQSSAKLLVEGMERGCAGGGVGE